MNRWTCLGRGETRGGCVSDMQTIGVWASGLYDLGFAVFHLTFWRLFRWPRSLESSGVLNTAVTQTLNIVLTYVFIVAGAAFVVGAVQDRSPTVLAIAGAGFWALRAALQPILFDMDAHKSKPMTLIFVIGVVLHGIAAIR